MGSAALTPCEALLAGEPEAAAALAEARVAANPADHDARYWLASARLALGDAEGAAAAFNDARTLHALALARGMGADLAQIRSDPEYAAKVASLLYGQHMVATASVVWAMSLAAGRIDASSLISYGLSLQHQGRIAEASDMFRVAVENFPSPEAHQFLLYAQLFFEDGVERYSHEAREWARRYVPAFTTSPHPNAALAGRPLRVAYVAPNFASSQLRQFIAPVLENHDPGRVSVTLYPARAETEAGWPSTVRIQPIGHLSDADAAALIRRDKIDVLADCWGHTAGSRIAVFARRPAPVQAAWINFIVTTGLEQIDYVLHASSDRPPEYAGLFAEEIRGVGPVFNAFRPLEGRLPPAPTPALRNSYVTFGSFHHPAKLGEPVIAAWAAILRRAPTSRLLLKYRYFGDPVLQCVMQARFAAHGVAPERLVFEGHSAAEAYFESFRSIDIALDVWPAVGSTTTLEALSNGVPVLALGPGRTLSGFYSRSILEAAGLPELVATSPADLVDRAAALAADPVRLDALRAKVRPGFDNGPCCDEAGFTRRLEAAFVEMFEAWRSGAAQERGAA